METPRTTLGLDAGNMRVSFSVRWFGVISVRGSFAGVTGMVEVPGPEGVDAQLSVNVESDSVHTGIGLRDRHLRGSRFLDSARHPRIRFENGHVSRNNGSWYVRGTLALRGLPCQVEFPVRDERASPAHRRLRAEFSVPRRPYAIGTARGIRRLNPLLWAIGPDVRIQVEVLVPATLLAAEHAPAR
ncbi:MAG TPA: YceI family protein [Gemmatimonadaceae bacterium]